MRAVSTAYICKDSVPFLSHIRLLPSSHLSPCLILSMITSRHSLFRTFNPLPSYLPFTLSLSPLSPVVIYISCIVASSLFPPVNLLTFNPSVDFSCAETTPLSPHSHRGLFRHIFFDATKTTSKPLPPPLLIPSDLLGNSGLITRNNQYWRNI